jgi:hypothetical protein
MINTQSTMGLKETIAKKILEAKLSKATKHAQSYIQKLQQQLDDLIYNKGEKNE